MSLISDLPPYQNSRPVGRISLDSAPAVESDGSTYKLLSIGNPTGFAFSDDALFQTENGSGSTWGSNQFDVGDLFIDANGQRYKITVYDILGDDVQVVDAGDNSGSIIPGDCVIMRPTEKFKFSAATMTTQFFTGPQAAVITQRSWHELDNFLNKLENLGNVDSTPGQNQILQYQGTSWVAVNASFGGTSTVTTSAPLTGDGTVGDPITIQDGTMKAQGLRYNGTSWLITLNAYDGVVASSGGDFTTLNDAIDAGCKHIAVVTDVSHTASASLTDNVTVKLFNNSTVTTTAGLDSAFSLGTNAIEIEGSGTLSWDPSAVGTNYFFNGSSGSLQMRGVRFNYVTPRANKSLANCKMELSDVELTLASADAANIDIVSSAKARLSNIKFIGGPTFAPGGHFLHVADGGSLIASGLEFDAVGNGTEVVILLEGSSNITNALFDGSNSNTVTINVSASSPPAPRQLSGIIGSSTTSIDVNISGSGAETLLANSHLGSVTITGDKNKINNCNMDSLSVTGSLNQVIGNNVGPGVLTVTSGATSTIVSSNLTDEPIVSIGSTGTILIGNALY